MKSLLRMTGCTAVLVLYIMGSACGSQGDIDISFRMCVKTCIEQTCSNNNKSKFGDGFPYWNCDDDCSYECVQSITSERSSQGYGPLKYHGHWPFLRLFGLEEPASTVFSLLNSVPYIISFGSTFTANQGRNQHSFMDSWLTLFYMISINTWFASAFFHSRKTEFASFYDYTSALLFLGYSLWLAVRRIMGVKATFFKVGSIFSTFLVLYLFQVSRMHAGLVSFDQHMSLSITIAVCNVVIWLSWLLFSSEGKGKGNYRYLCLICQLWFSLAALLELFDFPAIWGLYDAHSLWHAATIPLGFLWAYFWKLDRDMCLIDIIDKES